MCGEFFSSSSIKRCSSVSLFLIKKKKGKGKHFLFHLWRKLSTVVVFIPKFILRLLLVFRENFKTVLHRMNETQFVTIFTFHATFPLRILNGENDTTRCLSNLPFVFLENSKEIRIFIFDFQWLSFIKAQVNLAWFTFVWKYFLEVCHKKRC